MLKENNPNQKRVKLASPVKQIQGQAHQSSPSAKLKLKWELMSVEDMEVARPIITEISAEASGQPRRQ